MTTDPTRPYPAKAILICAAPGSGKSTMLALAVRESIAAGQRVAWVRPAWDTNDLCGADGVVVADLAGLEALDLAGYDLVVLDHMEAILGNATIEMIDAYALRWSTRVTLATERIPQPRLRATRAA